MTVHYSQFTPTQKRLVLQCCVSLETDILTSDFTDRCVNYPIQCLVKVEHLCACWATVLSFKEESRFSTES